MIKWIIMFYILELLEKKKVTLDCQYSLSGGSALGGRLSFRR